MFLFQAFWFMEDKCEKLDKTLRTGFHLEQQPP